MCDYSLEAYKTRPAHVGETIRTQRFPSGSIGFVAPENETVAVCLASDTTLELTHVPASVVRADGQRAAKMHATFLQLDTTAYRDAVRLANGHVVTLQQLGAGVIARVVDTLTGAMSDTEASRQNVSERALEDGVA
ncbi:MAG: hypothetical protein AAGJ70_02195 [Pseudomonadota bacterium]